MFLSEWWNSDNLLASVFSNFLYLKKRKHEALSSNLSTAKKTFFFLMVLAFELWVLNSALSRQILYHLSHTASPNSRKKKN
jgi:hypothetical protein